ncbi:peptidase inhibitor family I36 protein [Nonomuraea sp. NPDC049400]|uniref:peptidase inhibitor family I36 protein n=1 Tax=Nonomuraea sp. NPDC049400 TaxID=3364352 RepID=UPI0037BB90E4
MKKIAVGMALTGLVLACLPGSSAAQAVSAATFCLYEHDDFKGGKWCTTPNYDRDLSNNYWAGTRRPVNDGASSMVNNTNCPVVLWSGKSWTGDDYRAQRRSSDKDFTNNGFDNRISSLYFDCPD